MRSSACSMPTDSLIRSAGTSSGESAADACVIRAGCSISDSTPPSDSPSVNSVVRPQMSTALSSGGDPEGHHAAECAHLGGGDLMARMLGQAGIVDVADGRVPGQHVRHPVGVGAVPVHPHRERLDPAQGEPGVEGTGDGAGGVLVERESWR